MDILCFPSAPGIPTVHFCPVTSSLLSPPKRLLTASSIFHQHFCERGGESGRRSGGAGSSGSSADCAVTTSGLCTCIMFTLPLPRTTSSWYALPEASRATGHVFTDCPTRVRRAVKEHRLSHTCHTRIREWLFDVPATGSTKITIKQRQMRGVAAGSNQ